MADANLTITRPDDWHLHVRDGREIGDIARHSARVFARAMVMPNLVPPVRTTDEAIAYRQRILAALPADTDFDPLMTLYLTDSTKPEEIERAAHEPCVLAVKLYPAGATTNSESGVTDIERAWAAIARMEELDLPLSVHGEVTDPSTDIFDRERVFIDRVLQPLIDRTTGLRVVFEHITTREAVDFVIAAPPRVAATITTHHLLLDRNAIFSRGLNPHHYCLPILKRSIHREALVEAATRGNPRFFLGSDSAPHPRSAKESAAGCAGVFSAHAAIELTAEVFEEAGALDRLEAFVAFHGADFYRLRRNTGKITLVRKSWKVPEVYPFGEHVVVPLRAGGEVRWRAGVELQAQ